MMLGIVNYISGYICRFEFLFWFVYIIILGNRNERKENCWIKFCVKMYV